MTVPVFSRRIQMQFLSQRSKNIITPLSAAAHSLSSTGHGSTVAAGFRTFSQDHSYQRWSKNDTTTGMFLSLAAATAGVSFLGLSSSQTLCESANAGPVVDDAGDDVEEEPEIDPYDNLPEEDEPTHCSICLTYRQGPCRPYWRKVEACTKDGEKDRKKKEEEEGEGSPDEPSTRCFKYMMPWIDCASQYKNLYTLIEMHTNYSEGIEELEATSRHFCWLPGTEPKIDWSNWEEAKDGNDNNQAAPIDESTDPVPLWKTFDPAEGDPTFITVDAEVPATINAGEGILECAYALDQDNNVIGFAYGTKPSELMEDEKTDDDEASGEEETKSKDDDSDEEKKESKGNLDKMVTLSIKLVESRTKGFTLAASYTHRIERPESEKDEGDNSPIGLESHLYKSKPFVLADIPKTC